jgi:hypothetical protein
MQEDNTINYWRDWMDAFNVDHSRYTQQEFIDWVNDMECFIGDALDSLMPDEWIPEHDDDEWEELPLEDDEDD